MSRYKNEGIGTLWETQMKVLYSFNNIHYWNWKTKVQKWVESLNEK